MYRWSNFNLHQSEECITYQFYNNLCVCRYVNSRQFVSIFNIESMISGRKFDLVDTAKINKDKKNNYAESAYI